MITHERARQILNCYGGDPRRWPENERTAMERLLSSHSELQKLQEQCLQLDNRLTELFSIQEEKTFEPLALKILARLPDRPDDDAQPIARARGKLQTLLQPLLDRPIPVWSMAGAALVILLAIGMLHFDQQPDTPQPQLANREDAWLLMADTLNQPNDLELLAVFEPELSEDNLDIL